MKKLVIILVLSAMGNISFAKEAKETKTRKPNQVTGNFGKDIDPKSAAMFQCLRETSTYIEDTPVLKDYRRILMKKMKSSDKVESQKASEAWQKMDEAIIALRLDPCEIVIDEKFPR